MDRRREIIRELKYLAGEIDGLLDMLREGGPLEGEKRTIAQERFRNLKEKLKTEYRAGSTARGQAEMSETESASYFPAVQEAYCSLSSRRFNSVPDSKWISDLSEARISIHFYLESLKSKG